MGRNKETVKKKIGALCVVAACSQFIKHNRKHSSVSNTGNSGRLSSVSFFRKNVFIQKFNLENFFLKTNGFSFQKMMEKIKIDIRRK